MQKEAPRGKMQKHQPSQPPSNNKNSTEYNEHVPNLASKFEVLIAALPPLPPKPTPRRSSAKIIRQGAKRRRGAVEYLFKTPISMQKQPQQWQEEEKQEDKDNGSLFWNLVGSRIAIWLPTSITTSKNTALGNNNNKPSPKGGAGAYTFGRVIGQEDVSPYRQIIKFDAPVLGVECAGVNLKNEIWVKLADDDHDDDASPPRAPNASLSLAEVPPDNQNTQDEMTTPENKRAERPLRFINLPEHRSPLPPPPLVFENEQFSVFTTTCGPVGYEILAVPGTLRIEDVKVECFVGGKVVLKVKRQATAAAGAGAAAGGHREEQADEGEEVELSIDLPTAIYPESAKALFTSTGQLYIRVDSKKKGKKMAAAVGEGDGAPVEEEEIRF